MSAIADEVAQRERLNREVEIAREVQERLFPQTLPPIAGIEYAGACRPALGVGGDYYDFLALPGGQLGIAIGDVSGKGIAAAFTMASLQASLRGEATRAPGGSGGPGQQRQSVGLRSFFRQSLRHILLCPIQSRIPPAHLRERWPQSAHAFHGARRRIGNCHASKLAGPWSVCWRVFPMSREW